MKLSDSYKKGWIPEFVPVSAIDIYEKHNLDNNNVWMHFFCNQSDLSKLLEDNYTINQDEPDATFLKKEFEISDTTTFYRISNKEMLAVESNTNKVYYFRIGY